MWVLDIPKNDNNNKLSAFGEDFGKYGYSEMTAEEIELERAKVSDRIISSPSKIMFPNVADLDENLYWKNPQGNKFDFSEVASVADGQNLGGIASKTGNFSVWSKLSLGFTPEEALSTTVLDSVEEDNRRMKIKIYKYIQQKLAL